MFAWNLVMRFFSPLLFIYNIAEVLEISLVFFSVSFDSAQDPIYKIGNLQILGIVTSTEIRAFPLKI